MANVLDKQAMGDVEPRGQYLSTGHVAHTEFDRYVPLGQLERHPPIEAVPGGDVKFAGHMPHWVLET